VAASDAMLSNGAADALSNIGTGSIALAIPTVKNQGGQLRSICHFSAVTFRRQQTGHGLIYGRL